MLVFNAGTLVKMLSYLFSFFSVALILALVYIFSFFSFFLLLWILRRFTSWVSREFKICYGEALLRRQEVPFISGIFTAHARVLVSGRSRTTVLRQSHQVDVLLTTWVFTVAFSRFHRVFFCLSYGSVYRKSTSERTLFATRPLGRTSDWKFKASVGHVCVHCEQFFSAFLIGKWGELYYRWTSKTAVEWRFFSRYTAQVSETASWLCS